MTIGDLLGLCDNDICAIDVRFKNDNSQMASRYYFDEIMGIETKYWYVASIEIDKWKMINPSLIEILGKRKKD